MHHYLKGICLAYHFLHTYVYIQVKKICIAILLTPNKMPTYWLKNEGVWERYSELILLAYVILKKRQQLAALHIN